MARLGRGGFTLMELLVATVLAFLVVGALMAISQPILRTRLDAAAFAGQQADAVFALRALRQDLTRATWIRRDGPAGELRGCANFHPDKGSDFDGVLDRTKPVVSFFYCLREGSLLRYEEAAFGGCPDAPRCGARGGQAVAKRVTSDPRLLFSYARPGVVGVSMTIAGKGQPYTVETAFAEGSGP